MSYEVAIQAAVYSILSNDAALSAMIEGVYDDVDENQAFPYVTIGESTHNEWDTGDTLGDDATITIHTWSRGRGKKQTKEIQGAIYNALHRVETSQTGYDFVTIQWQDSTSLIDADGKTRHGVQNFRILIERN